MTGRLYEAADLYVAGDDAGVGFLDPGPPLQVGGVNAAAGSSARLVQGTPAWSHYQESFYDSVYSVIDGSTNTSAPNFSDTIDPALGDNDVGVQWDFASLAIDAGPDLLHDLALQPLLRARPQRGPDAGDRQDRDGDRDRAQRRRRPGSRTRGALLDRRARTPAAAP